MADADPRRDAAPQALPLPDYVALVLQGGGALGSYQAGVIEALADAGDRDRLGRGHLDRRGQRRDLRRQPARAPRRAAAQPSGTRSTSALPSFPIWPQRRRCANASTNGRPASVMAAGVPGFFTPAHACRRCWPPPGTPEALSFYDSAPLAATLDALIDWDLLNDGPVRLSVGAVDVESGNFRYFDTDDRAASTRATSWRRARCRRACRRSRSTGSWYWDGGLVSNTPLTHVLDHQTGDTAGVPGRSVPRRRRPCRSTIMDVMAREKEIRFSSRTRQVSDRAAQAAPGARGDPHAARQAARRTARRPRRRSRWPRRRASIRSTSSS